MPVREFDCLRLGTPMRTPVENAFIRFLLDPSAYGESGHLVKAAKVAGKLRHIVGTLVTAHGVCLIRLWQCDDFVARNRGHCSPNVRVYGITDELKRAVGIDDVHAAWVGA